MCHYVQVPSAPRWRLFLHGEGPMINASVSSQRNEIWGKPLSVTLGENGPRGIGLDQ